MIWNSSDPASSSSGQRPHQDKPKLVPCSPLELEITPFPNYFPHPSLSSDEGMKTACTETVSTKTFLVSTLQKLSILLSYPAIHLTTQETLSFFISMLELERTSAQESLHYEQRRFSICASCQLYLELHDVRDEALIFWNTELRQ